MVNRYNGQPEDDRPIPAWQQPSRPTAAYGRGSGPLPPPATPEQFRQPGLYRDNGIREYPPAPAQGFSRYEPPRQQNGGYAQPGPVFGQAAGGWQQPAAQPQQWQPGPYQQTPQFRSPARKHTARNVFAALVGFLILVIGVAVAGSSGHAVPTSGSAGPGTSTAATGSTPADTAPAGTVSEMQALVAAQDYLSEGRGFSRQGLIGQLDSPDGNGFSVADATWAVDNSGANWDEQAVDSAKAYMSSGEGFSREGLIQQLTSSYGDQFTEAQATYAVNTVGL